MKKRRRKINFQKLFCFASFIFIFTCCLWYGSRVIYYYLDNKKKTEGNEKSLAQTIIKENNLKKISDNYYFYKDIDNNYLTYSNLTFRIIKVAKNNEITLISDNPITYLAFGKNKNLKNSYITNWLNLKEDDDYSGLLQNNLNDISKYLVKTKTCSDEINDVKKITCNKLDKNNYLSLLSLVDYINTGGKNSYINNGYYTYLANNSSDDIWYIDNNGDINKSDGTDIQGVKFTITLNQSATIKKGNGTKENPYIIEDKTNYFASYVKLDNDIWRVYNESNDTLKLSLTNYIKDNNQNIEHSYSENNYHHNDTKYGSLAYYLNNTYLNKLTYKDIIIESKYYNNFYNEENNYDYEDTINKKIDTKVANLSIGDVFLNDLHNYFIATAKNNTTIYSTQKYFTIEEADIAEEKNIIPCITIKKDNIKNGSGTKDDPYRTE